MYIVELGLVMGVNIYMFFCLRIFFFYNVLYNVLNFVTWIYLYFEKLL